MKFSPFTPLSHVETLRTHFLKAIYFYRKFYIKAVTNRLKILYRYLTMMNDTPDYFNGCVVSQKKNTVFRAEDSFLSSGKKEWEWYLVKS